MEFELKSIPICINMGALACLSNDKSHFKGIGTVQWLVLDNQRNKVKLSMQNTLFILATQMCLL